MTGVQTCALPIWDEQIAILGSADRYTTTLAERSWEYRPEGFPVYKRSPRLIKRTSLEKIVIELPPKEEKQDPKGFLMSVIPPLGMRAVTIMIGVLLGRGLYLLMSAAAAGMTAVFSGIRYMGEKKELREKNRIRHVDYMNYLWNRQKEIAMAYEREQEVYAYQYPDMDELAFMVKEYDSRIYEKISSDEDFLTLSLGRYMGKTGFQIGGKEEAQEAQKDTLTKTVCEIRQKYSQIQIPRVIDLKKTDRKSVV